MNAPKIMAFWSGIAKIVRLNWKTKKWNKSSTSAKRNGHKNCKLGMFSFLKKYHLNTYNTSLKISLYIILSKNILNPRRYIAFSLGEQTFCNRTLKNGLYDFLSKKNLDTLTLQLLWIRNFPSIYDFTYTTIWRLFPFIDFTLFPIFYMRIKEVSIRVLFC